MGWFKSATKAIKKVVAAPIKIKLSGGKGGFSLSDLDPTKAIKKAGSALEDTILTPIKKAGVQVEDATKKAGSALNLGGIEDAIKTAGSKFDDNVIEKIKPIGSSLDDAVHKAGSDIGDQVLEPLKDSWSQVEDNLLVPIKKAGVQIEDGIRNLSENAYKAEDLVRQPEAPVAEAAPIAPTMPTMDSEAIAKARRRQLAAAMLRGGRSGSILTGQSETLGG